MQCTNEKTFLKNSNFVVIFKYRFFKYKNKGVSIRKFCGKYWFLAILKDSQIVLQNSLKDFFAIMLCP